MKKDKNTACSSPDGEAFFVPGYKRKEDRG